MISKLKIKNNKMKKVMKTFYVVAVVLAGYSLTACSSDTTTEAAIDATTETTEETVLAEEVYYCPMHPEIEGKKGDECDLCGGMKLVRKGSKELEEEHHH